MRPAPVTTPSPGIRCSAIPKSAAWWTTNRSSSSKEPLSTSSSIRSRAVFFPALCWRAMRSSPPPTSASRRRRRSSAKRSSRLTGGSAGRSRPQKDETSVGIIRGASWERQTRPPERVPDLTARGASVTVGHSLHEAHRIGRRGPTRAQRRRTHRQPGVRRSRHRSHSRASPGPANRPGGRADPGRPGARGAPAHRPAPRPAPGPPGAGPARYARSAGGGGRGPHGPGDARPRDQAHRHPRGHGHRGPRGRSGAGGAREAGRVHPAIGEEQSVGIGGHAMAEGRDDLNFLGALGLITVGGIIGAGVALLLAPKTGEETRELLREKGGDFARRAQERGSEFARRAQETVGEAQVKAQEYLGRGKEVMEEKSAQLRAAFEAGRSAMREEISKLRGRDEPMEGV